MHSRIFSFLFACLLTVGCKVDNSTEGGSPPCNLCPGDFRLTDFEPAWSPDGRIIAYVHGDTILGMTGIWLIDTNRTNKRILIRSASAYSPAWSPDGRWIAYSDGAQIYKITVNGDTSVQLTTEGRNFFPTFSPDGEWIAYDSNSESPNGMNFIWKMKVDGSGKTRISYEPTQGEVRMPSWSRVGGKIMHIRYFVGTFSSEIVVMDTNGANAVRLTTNSATDNYPRYSPTGAKIAFTSKSADGLPQIWVMNANGTNPAQLTTTQGFTCDWSADGEWIVYTDSRTVNGRLWLIRKDGTEKRQFTF